MNERKNMLVIIADTHFGVKKNDRDFLENQLSFFENQLFPYLKKNKIENVFHLGDFFDNREVIDVYVENEVINRVIEFFEKHKIHLYILIGNHDIYFKNTTKYHSLKKFEKYDYIHIINENKVLQIDGFKYKFYAVKWITDIKTFDMSQLKSADILLGHFEFKDFNILKNYKSKKGLDINNFSQYKLIFSGHFHIRSEEKNLIYVGTPYQLNWNDYNTSKGFYVLKDNFEYEFIENKVSKKFIKLFYSEKNGKIDVEIGGIKNHLIKPKNKEDFLSLVKNNLIKIVIKELESSQVFDTFYLTLSKYCNDITIVNANKIIDVDTGDKLEDVEVEEFDKLFELYIQNNYKKSSKKLIMLMSKLLKEVENDNI